MFQISKLMCCFVVLCGLATFGGLYLSSHANEATLDSALEGGGGEERENGVMKGEEGS